MTDSIYLFIETLSSTMWWITNSSDGRHIMKATMSGENIQRFHDDLVTLPSNLAVDRSMKTLVWIDDQNRVKLSM